MFVNPCCTIIMNPCDISTSRMVLTREKDGFHLKAMCKETWQTAYASQKPTDVIYDLKGVAEAVFKSDKFLGSPSDTNVAVVKRLKEACQKHNKNPMQYLKWLLIPWIASTRPSKL